MNIENDTVIHCTTEQETINVFNVLKGFDYKLDFTSGKEYWKNVQTTLYVIV